MNKNNNNAYLTIKRTSKGGKKYENLVVHLTLENGKVVVFQVKESFYNRKFHSLLACNLPLESTENGDK